MLTPFAPFFILFCYIIETSSAEDLAILQNFASTLNLARDASEASHKFATLCKVMCEVVTLYVEAKSQQNVDQTMGPIGDEFEMYLNQLGFMPMVRIPAKAVPQWTMSRVFNTQREWVTGIQEV